MFELDGSAEYQEASCGRVDIVAFVPGFQVDLEWEHSEFRAPAMLVARLVECGPERERLPNCSVTRTPGCGLSADDSGPRASGGATR